jgi:hypothetical protein
MRGMTGFVVIGLSALWYYIKYVLRQNGYKTYWFWGHFIDIVNLHSLHNQEQNYRKKLAYKLLLFSFYVGLLLFFVAAIQMFSR